MATPESRVWASARPRGQSCRHRWTNRRVPTTSTLENCLLQYRSIWTTSQFASYLVVITRNLSSPARSPSFSIQKPEKSAVMSQTGRCISRAKWPQNLTISTLSSWAGMPNVPQQSQKSLWSQSPGDPGDSMKTENQNVLFPFKTHIHFLSLHSPYSLHPTASEVHINIQSTWIFLLAGIHQ